MITRPLLLFSDNSSLSVPCGFADRGLPVGFQLMGPPYSEELLFQIGHAYQRETDWHTQAPDL